MSTITPETEIKRVLDRLRSLGTERGPSTILDKGDAKILLDYIGEIEEIAETEQSTRKYHVYQL